MEVTHFMFSLGCKKGSKNLMLADMRFSVRPINVISIAQNKRKDIIPVDYSI